MKRPKAACFVLLSSLLAPLVDARADGLTAEALFQEGRKLLDQGNRADACAKFEASHHAQASVGALMNLADCALALDRTATAWLRLREAVNLASKLGDSRRAREASQQADALEPKLSRLAIDVTETAPQEKVERDGAPVDPSSFGTGLPVDPGPHTISASAEGRKTWSTTATVESGKSVTVRVPRLEAPRLEAPRRTETEPATHRPTWAWVAGGAGVACLVGAGGFFIGALDSASNVRGQCPDGRCADQGALERAAGDRDSATQSALVSTILGAAGVALVATAIVVLVGASPRSGH